MLINVIGWYNEKNAGDEAFRMVFDQLFHDHEVIYSKSSVKEADRIVFGGGGVMCKSYLENVDGKSLYALGVDVHLNGPEYVRLRSMNFKSIIIRSKEYADIAKAQGWMEVSYAPDIAFSLDYPKWDAVKDQVGIILTHELPQDKEKDICQFIQYLQTLGKRPVFIAMYEGVHKPDFNVCKRIARTYYDSIPIHKNFSPIAVIKSISTCEFVLSMRFHGSIFASAMGIPFLSIANKGKHSLFCDQENMSECFLSLDCLNFENLKKRYDNKKDDGFDANKNYLLLNNHVLPEFRKRVISGL